MLLTDKNNDVRSLRWMRMRLHDVVQPVHAGQHSVEPQSMIMWLWYNSFSMWKVFSTVQGADPKHSRTMICSSRGVHISRAVPEPWFQLEWWHRVTRTTLDTRTSAGPIVCTYCSGCARYFLHFSQSFLVLTLLTLYNKC